MPRAPGVDVIRMFRPGRVARVAVALAGAAVLSAGAVSGAADAAAQVPAAAGTPVGGGWVATPTAVHAAQMILRVPTLTCAKKKSATVTVGLFGSTVSKTKSAPWEVGVVASCRRGTASYRGVAVDFFGRYTVLRLHAGDRVKLLKPDAVSYEIDDFTSRHSAGGGSLTAGDGRQPVLTTPVLFGARVDGSVHRPLRVQVQRTRANRTALGALAHHRQPQVHDGHAVARAVGLGKDGAFTITVAATSGVRSVPAPVITALSSHSGTAAGDDTLTIYGSHLADLRYVQFGSARCRAYYRVGDGKLVIGTPDHAAAGTVNVRVVTAEGSSPITPVDRFTYTAGA